MLVLYIIWKKTLLISRCPCAIGRINSCHRFPNDVCREVNNGKFDELCRFAVSQKITNYPPLILRQYLLSGCRITNCQMFYCFVSFCATNNSTFTEALAAINMTSHKARKS